MWSSSDTWESLFHRGYSPSVSSSTLAEMQWFSWANLYPSQSWVQGWKLTYLSPWISTKKIKTEQDSVGLLDTKAFLCSLLFAGNRFYSASKTFPEFQLSRFKQMLIRGRSSQETIVQSWGRVLVSPQGIHRTISLAVCRYSNTHQVEEVNCLLPASP